MSVIYTKNNNSPQEMKETHTHTHARTHARTRTRTHTHTHTHTICSRKKQTYVRIKKAGRGAPKKGSVEHLGVSPVAWKKYT